ncbi:valine--tRNA ligase, partial [Candidatus Omnitrophota bacterium]
DPKFGTGIVKVTPAHDPNDFQMGARHNLESVNIMHPNGVLNENAGEYDGMDRFEAREALLEDLKQRGLLDNVETHQHSVGHCYRCHTIVEPYLSKQWFVNMKPLAEPAIKAVEDGRIKFHPKRWTKVYLEWMNNIRDWCISRQIWWGHRIPVFYCKQCQEKNGMNSKIKNKKSKLKTETVNRTPKTEPGVIVSKVKPEKCPDCGSKELVQDEDVLDTWFSSWLWPFSTFGWPFDSTPEGQKQKQELEYFYPTSTLVTAQEIIFFWVARMIMAGIEICGDIPFKDVYIHGTVRDDTGTKMSKSLGNVIDPLKVIDEYGADALRFSIISITAVGQDVFLSEDKFQMGRNFANKIWNVSRFLLMNLDDQISADLCVVYDREKLSLPDRWILSALFRTIEGVEKALDSFKINDAANLLYEFIWHKYCDWYVEIAKASIKEPTTQVILFKVLEKSLRMLHPFMPFITEEIWQQLGEKEPIAKSKLPHIQRQIINEQAEADMEHIISIIVSIRNIRAEMNIGHKLEIEAVISSPKKEIIDLQDEIAIYASRLANVKSLKIGKAAKRPQRSASSILDFCEIFIPLEGIIDVEIEKARLQKGLKETESMLASLDKKLSNKNFVDRAPADIVAKERDKQDILKDKLTRISSNIENLS